MVDIPSPKEKKVKFPSAEVEKKGCVYYFNSFKAPPSNHIRFTLVLLKCSSWILQQWFYIHWRTFKNLVEVCETFSAVFFSFSHTFDCRGAQSAQKGVRSGGGGESTRCILHWEWMSRDVAADCGGLCGALRTPFRWAQQQTRWLLELSPDEDVDNLC